MKKAQVTLGQLPFALSLIAGFSLLFPVVKAFVQISENESGLTGLVISFIPVAWWLALFFILVVIFVPYRQNTGG